MLMISSTEAPLNQGKALKATKISWSASKTQKPCFEMLVTSAPEMFFPSVADFIFALLDDGFGRTELRCRHSEISCELNPWRQPELCFTTFAIDVNVYSALLTREKVETKSSSLKDSRTQARPLLTSADASWPHFVPVRQMFRREIPSSGKSTCYHLGTQGM